MILLESKSLEMCYFKAFPTSFLSDLQKRLSVYLLGQGRASKKENTQLTKY